MNEHEKAAISTEERKAKIRQRYKGISRDELEVRPAIQPASFQDDTSEKRVAVYARVSTGDPNQTSSYELQKNHYQDMVSRHPGWNLVHIYADEGISGTSLKHRDEFIKMIAACEAGQIDLIVTKSVSRFARNVLDCIGKVRELAALPKPVGVFFETENIYTLNSNSEMSLSFISTLAQEESHTKSEIMNASIEMRFSRGIFLTPELLGYDKDPEGNLIVNKEEALTVRLIFFMFLYGYGCAQIAETLMELGRLTKPGNKKWTAGTVMNVLQNERYCGDILARKTYTPNYLDHRSKKNRQNRNAVCLEAFPLFRSIPWQIAGSATIDLRWLAWKGEILDQITAFFQLFQLDVEHFADTIQGQRKRQHRSLYRSTLPVFCSQMRVQISGNTGSLESGIESCLGNCWIDQRVQHASR